MLLLYIRHLLLIIFNLFLGKYLLKRWKKVMLFSIVRNRWRVKLDWKIFKDMDRLLKDVMSQLKMLILYKFIKALSLSLPPKGWPLSSVHSYLLRLQIIQKTTNSAQNHQTLTSVLSRYQSSLLCLASCRHPPNQWLASSQQNHKSILFWPQS